MRSKGLRVVMMSVAVLVIALIITLQRSTSRADVSALRVPSPPAALGEVAPTAELDAPRSAAEPVAIELTNVDDAKPEPEPASAPGAFEFDITFAPVDSLGRPLPGTSVELGLLQHRPNRMGTSADNGLLHCTWRGNQARVECVVNARANSESSPLERVELVAGGPCLVRFCADRMRSRTVDRPAIDGGDESRPMNDAPAFEVDAAGNGLFTDPDLLVRERVEVVRADHRGGRPSPFSTRRLGSGSYKRPLQARIEGVVRDSNGRPLAHVPWRLAGESGQGIDGRLTDSQGRFELVRTAPSRVELEFGGGEFALARRSIDVVDGTPPTCDVEVGTLPSIHGRLTDGRGAPLAAWRVQARQIQPPFGFVQAAVTDAKGQFALGIADGLPVRIVAGPLDENDTPPVLLASSIAPTERAIELAVRDVQERSNASWRIQVPCSVFTYLPQARVIDRDAGVGVTLDPCDGGQTLEGFTTWAFCFDKALSDAYQIVTLAPGCSSTSAVMIGPGERDLGEIDVRPTVQLIAAENETDAKVQGSMLSVRTMDQGMIVRSDVLTWPGRFHAPAGELQLNVRCRTSAGAVVEQAHAVSAAPGARIDVPIDAP